MRQQSARIVFSGDTIQMQSVEAADALRILERESHLKSVSLTQVQRQSVKEYRKAIQELWRHPERGFEKLKQIGGGAGSGGSLAGSGIAIECERKAKPCAGSLRHARRDRQCHGSYPGGTETG